MAHTVHVVCDATTFDEPVTLPTDALILDLFTEAGLTDPMELLTYRPVYYRSTRPVHVSIVQSVTSIPEGEILFVHKRGESYITRR